MRIRLVVIIIIVIVTLASLVLLLLPFRFGSTVTATSVSTQDVAALRLTIAPAITPIARNADWTPVEQDFDGVPMVLVPAGCFTMGSTEGEQDELPPTPICFAAPFWIDLYEVTQGDFARLGGQAADGNAFEGEDRPRENITWYESRDFCTLRGARLPTEAEWEYAARGPDSLIYPWGNTFVAENVVSTDNSNTQTAAVGSRAAGRSWVGAYDLSGNLSEWTSTIYQRYPYPTDANGLVIDDGREDEASTGVEVRALRGGSWAHRDIYLTGSNRNTGGPTNGSDTIGFRCARNAG